MSAPTPDQARALIEAGRRLYEDGLLGGTAGNLSVRVPGADTLLVTATGVHKGRLQPADVRAVPLTAGDPDRDAGATSELPFHRACYRADPSVGAVVHTHAPALTAVGIRQLPLTGALPELEAAVGRVAVVDPLPSGSRALAEGVGAAVAQGARVLVLRNHGAVTVGATLAEAVDRMEMAELAAYAVVMAAEGAAGIDLSRVQRLTDRVGG